MELKAVHINSDSAGTACIFQKRVKLRCHVADASGKFHGHSRVKGVARALSACCSASKGTRFPPKEEREFIIHHIGEFAKSST